MNNVYITTPIYYVNGEPHIGHFYTSLASDVLIRLYCNLGYDVRFLTGTDEHGQKVQQSAKKAGISPKEFCDKVSSKFKQMFIDFDLIHSRKNFENGKNFIRTTDEKHVKFIQEVWTRLENNGWIYKGEYKGWYSVRDECFYTEKELINGKAPTGSEVQLQKEECYFFKLSLFQDALYELYKNNNIIQPKSSLAEILSFLDPNKEDNKLNDLCISRSKKIFDWGIDVPNDNNHVIYVWVDALFNYFSALGGDNTPEFDKYWSNGFQIHLMGKEIIRFHAVYWESLIYSLYNKVNEKINIEELKKVSPKQIFAHGWWVKDGEKMSKSIGNIVVPEDEIKWIENLGIKHEVAIDYFRFFLIFSVPFGNDGNYSREKLIETVNAHLVNNIGNLCHRVTSILLKNFSIEKCKDIKKNFEKINFEKEIKNIDFTAILQKILFEADMLNQEFNDLAPWTLIKGSIEEKQKAFEILGNFISKITRVVTAIEPFCPHISKLLLNNLKLEKTPDIVCERLNA